VDDLLVAQVLYSHLEGNVPQSILKIVNVSSLCQLLQFLNLSGLLRSQNSVDWLIFHREDP